MLQQCFNEWKIELFFFKGNLEEANFIFKEVVKFLSAIRHESNILELLKAQRNAENSWEFIAPEIVVWQEWWTSGGIYFSFV